MLSSERKARGPVPAFGDQMRKRRLEIGLTMEALAKDIGVSWLSVWRWEKGRNIPHPVMLERWERSLTKFEKRFEQKV